MIRVIKDHFMLPNLFMINNKDDHGTIVGLTKERIAFVPYIGPRVLTKILDNLKRI